MNVSEPFIRRPIATTLLMVGLTLAGVAAYTQLPVAALPQVDYPTIQVSATLPGASPETMASSVTTPLERQFGQMPSLTLMTSVSSFGNSQITLQFDLARDIDAAQQDVQAAINTASNLLPKTLPMPPTYSKSNPADAPVLTLSLNSDSVPLSQIDDVADSILAQKIAQVSGVGLVTIGGGQKPAVRVQVDPEAVAGLGLGLEDVRTAILAANVNQPKGTIDGKRQSFTVAADDQLMTAHAYDSVVIATAADGSPVHLSDVATVIDGVENAQLAGWANNKPAVILNVQRQPGANIIAVTDRIKQLIPDLRAALPKAVDLKLIADRTETIRASVKDVQFTLLLTIGLVVAVIFFFLRSVWATIIPGVAVPLSLIGTFGVMYVLGYSLDNLSLMALTISTGFVVDDAIVMIENISRFMEQGDSPLEAALKGSKQIGFTIISLTVSLVAVLIPLLFMGGVIGRLFREFAVTLAVAIIVSALLSLSLTPMMCAKLLRHEKKEGRFYQISERFFDGMVHFYERGLRWVLANQFKTLVVTVGTLLLTVSLFLLVPKGFFPSQDTGLITGVSEAPPDVSFPEMMKRQEALSRIVMQDKDILAVASYIGVDGTNATPNAGRLSISLRSREERSASAQEIIRRLQPALQQVEGITLFMQPVQDLQVDTRTSRTQFQYTLEDSNADELRETAPELLKKMQAMPELADVASDQQAQGLQTALTIDRDTAARLGVSPQNIDDALYDAFGQRQVSIIFTQLNQYRVILEVQPAFQQDPSALDHIYVRSATGAQVRLSAFTSKSEVHVPLSISHQGQFPCVTLSFNLAPGAALGDATKAIEKANAEIGMPAGIRAGFQGTAQAFRESLASEPLLILAALITVYIVLGVLYESYIHPITILSTLPSAGVGALLALMLCHTEFDVIALIGIILLIGIVKKNAIMMIDFAIEAEREEHLSPHDAIAKAALLRFRPIMMTTMAALLGGLPLALGSGTGAELRRPLGISIVGGLLISQMLTLYTTPVVYLYMERMSRAFREWRHGKDPAPAIAEAPEAS